MELDRDWLQRMANIQGEHVRYRARLGYLLRTRMSLAEAKVKAAQMTWPNAFKGISLIALTNMGTK